MNLATILYVGQPIVAVVLLVVGIVLAALGVTLLAGCEGGPRP